MVESFSVYNAVRWPETLTYTKGRGGGGACYISVRRSAKHFLATPLCSRVDLSPLLDQCFLIRSTQHIISYETYMGS